MSHETEQFIKPKSDAHSVPSPFRNEAIPDVDPDRVARAKALLAQEGYPGTQVLKSVARHLATHWPASDDSSPPSRQV